MPAGRLLGALRPVGRRLQTSYTRAGKAVQPQANRGAGREVDAEAARDADPAGEEAAVPKPTPDSKESGRAEEDKDAEPQNAAERKQEGEARDEPPGPMEVLYMREPTVVPGKKHPPMPYTHYFDTYQMVNRLTSAGFQKGAAVTTMKAVRALLGAKMQEAQERLVSKGDVDNVSGGLARVSVHSFTEAVLVSLGTNSIPSIPRWFPSLSYPYPILMYHTRTEFQTNCQTRKINKTKSPRISYSPQMTHSFPSQSASSFC